MTTSTASTGSGSRAKFIIGGLLIVAAVVYLVVSSTQAAAQYYLTIDEMLTKVDELDGRAIKLAGAVDGESVEYDASTLTLSFTMANVPADLDEIEQGGGLAKVLYDALRDRIFNDPIRGFTDGEWTLINRAKDYLYGDDITRRTQR